MREILEAIVREREEVELRINVEKKTIIKFGTENIQERVVIGQVAFEEVEKT